MTAVWKQYFCVSQLVAYTQGAQMPSKAEPLAGCTDLYNTNLQHNTDLSHSTDLSHGTYLSRETARGELQVTAHLQSRTQHQHNSMFTRNMSFHYFFLSTQLLNIIFPEINTAIQAACQHLNARQG